MEMVTECVRKSFLKHKITGYMETKLSEIVTALEKEKCSFHRYRAMVFERNGKIQIIGCCKSFESFLETKSKEMIRDRVYEVNRVPS